jgi:hypothetical protein
VAFISADRERLPIAMNPRFHTRHQWQCSLVIVAELAHFEDLVRTSLDAILFGLASRAIDHRREDAARLLLALGFR